MCLLGWAPSHVAASPLVSLFSTATAATRKMLHPLVRRGIPLIFKTVAEELHGYGAALGLL